VDKAQTKVRDFRAWIEAHKDELAALQVLYAGTKPLKLSLKDLRQLRDALAVPPLAATPAQLWRAFEIVDLDKVAEAAPGTARHGEPLADLVSLVRHALAPDMPLEPYREEVRLNYSRWIQQKELAGTSFTAEQREWLDRIAEHIATSLEIAPDDFQDGWFGQHGSLGKAHALFGDQLHPLLAELNERLAA
jgi:type I restriction enzyme R subunit